MFQSNERRSLSSLGRAPPYKNHVRERFSPNAFCASNNGFGTKPNPKSYLGVPKSSDFPLLFSPSTLIAKTQEVIMSSETTSSREDKLSAAAEHLQKYAKPIFNAITVLIPIVIKYGKKVHALYVKLPANELNFLLGCVFCFFGGLYPVLFAAAMAAEYGGRQTIFKALGDLANEAIVIIDQSQKDDEKDENKDGVKDVEQITSKEFVQRKTLLVLQKMNPEKVDTAISEMYKVWLSVAAVLSIQFARTISFAMAIADFLKKPVSRYLAPTVQSAIPDQYDRWVPIVLGWYVYRLNPLLMSCLLNLPCSPHFLQNHST